MDTALPVEQVAVLANSDVIRMLLPVLVRAEDVPLEGGTDPAFGTVRWRTLLCGDRTATGDMVVGIAEFGPGGTLPAHRHSPAEVYFGLAGAGIVTIDGIPHPMAPGVALFMPADAEHQTLAGEQGLQFLYIFPRDRFSEIEYRFSGV